MTPQEYINMGFAAAYSVITGWIPLPMPAVPSLDGDYIGYPKRPAVHSQQSTNNTAIGTMSVYWRRHNAPTQCRGLFDSRKPGVAHMTLPCGTPVRLTNTATRRTIEAVVNDRPLLKHHRNVIAELTKAAGDPLGISRRNKTAVIRITW